MKKLFTMLLVLLVLCGCSSANTADDPTRSADVVATFDESTLSRKNTEGTRQADYKENLISKSADISRENTEFLAFIESVKDILYSETPEDAYYPAVKYAEGQWMFVLVGDENNFGAVVNEIGLADFSINYQTEEFTIELHPRLLNYQDELYEEDDESAGYLPFTGGFEGDGIKLYDGDGLIFYLYSYYDYEGCEYLIGELWQAEEAYLDFLMFRGQQ